MGRNTCASSVVSPLPRIRTLTAVLDIVRYCLFAKKVSEVIRSSRERCFSMSLYRFGLQTRLRTERRFPLRYSRFCTRHRGMSRSAAAPPGARCTGPRCQRVHSSAQQVQDRETSGSTSRSTSKGMPVARNLVASPPSLLQAAEARRQRVKLVGWLFSGLIVLFALFSVLSWTVWEVLGLFVGVPRPRAVKEKPMRERVLPNGASDKVCGLCSKLEQSQILPSMQSRGVPPSTF